MGRLDLDPDADKEEKKEEEEEEKDGEEEENDGRTSLDTKKRALVVVNTENLCLVLPKELLRGCRLMLPRTTGAAMVDAENAAIFEASVCVSLEDEVARVRVLRRVFAARPRADRGKA